MDGVFVAPEADGPLRFLKLGAPDVAEVRAVGWSTCENTVALLRKQGRWFDADAGMATPKTPSRRTSRCCTRSMARPCRASAQVSLAS
jgi:hypothetical protein